jgi:hypothetical protein
MTPDCVAAVRAQVGDVFSEKEILDLLNRVADRARRAMKAAPDLAEREAISSAAKALTHEEILKALLQKRNDTFRKAAKARLTKLLDAMPAARKGWQRLEAAMVGSARLGKNLGRSTDAEGVARSAFLVKLVNEELDKDPALREAIENFWGIPEKGFPLAVAREMAILNGDGAEEPTGDDRAVKLARILVNAQRRGVRMQNDLGAWIGDLKGYVARQSHDPMKIAGGYFRELAELAASARAGEDVQGGALGLEGLQDRALARAWGEWRDFIRPRLDDRTFDGLDQSDFDMNVARGLQARGIIKDAGDLPELMLHQIWMNIKSGRHAEISGADDMADYRPNQTAARLAAQVSRARVLHFQKAEMWMEYNQRYGAASLFKTVMQQLDRAGRNSALLERWGPTPQNGFEVQRDRLFKQAEEAGDTRSMEGLTAKKLQTQFETINGMGDVPENMRLATTFRTIRTVEGLAKLGSIILSKTTDLPLAGHTMARLGGNLSDGYLGPIRALLRMRTADAKEAADAMYVSSRSFASHLAGQWYAGDAPPGVTSYLSSLMMRANGFEGLNQTVRFGAAEMISRRWGQQVDLAWADLRQGTRETFERFGITPEDWDAVRQGIEPASDGRRYFTLDHVDGLADAAEGKDAQAWDERRWKFAAAVHDALDDVVSHPRARERAMMSFGTRAGTVEGEIIRSFGQFKGFVTTILGRHLWPATMGYAGMSPVWLQAHFWVAGAIAGYLGMSLKQAVRGELPRNPFGPDAGNDVKTWLGALAQSGGLGIYGDWLFGTQNRSGAAFDFGQLGGPMISDAEQVALIVNQAVHGGAVSETTGRSPIPGELVRLGLHEIPFSNLFYTRALFDYGIAWTMQEAASPGYLQRVEERTEKEGGKYWLRPTSAPQWLGP